MIIDFFNERQQKNDYKTSEWYLGYKDTIQKVKLDSDITDQTLELLWYTRNNYVSSLRQGAPSHEEFQRAKTLLRELTLKIKADPSEQTYKEAVKTIQQAKADGVLNKVYRALLNRVFAAIAPDKVTSTVDEGCFYQIAKQLDKDYNLGLLLNGDWFKNNLEFKQAIRSKMPEGYDDLFINMATWHGYEDLTNEQSQGVEDVQESYQIKTSTVGQETSPLNQILFGPPGTGKTYHTIDKALAILEPSLLIKPGVTRDELKAAFNRYQEAGQVAFVTFHQSFSYEDFVEGIRAESREDGALEYKVEPGVFAKLCERGAGRGVVTTDAPFEQALRELGDQADQSDDGWLPMQTTRGKRFRAHYSPEKRTFLIDQENRQGDRNPDSANMEHVRTLYQTDEKVGYNTSYVQGMLDYLKNHCGLPSQYEPPVSVQRKPFVLIIDEINRGNVSRIFGELITLIEPSKRAGACEALTTTLPYSKRPFSVPDNLYLIGTMNTADRSLAGLDIALRRRFEFEEMPPRPDLLEGVVIEEGGHSVNVGELLNVLNQRIEVLLDRDHCLGHAYFMQLNDDPTLERLSKIFQNQVLPLLQEYFFEDWQRIAWVLNDHRKSSPETMFLQAPKLEIKALLGDDVPVGGQRRRWTLNPAAFGNIVAYALTIAGDKGAQ
ncbi:AAA family ATPase [Aeromonas piscicola]|uniref:McrB family protein n=1 Tax=Aeromonas piscicola TaxID=600645 RepID=UPI0028E6AF87|nr:AAA family ATPase [Aeromonas piscicola]